MHSQNIRKVLRQEAMLQHAEAEQKRLNRHRLIALDLLNLPIPARNSMIENARVVVKLWQEKQLCSSDYINRWASILDLPVQEMAVTMIGNIDGWGRALRQCSPWVGLHANS